MAGNRDREDLIKDTPGRLKWREIEFAIRSRRSRDRQTRDLEARDAHKRAANIYRAAKIKGRAERESVPRVFSLPVARHGREEEGSRRWRRERRVEKRGKTEREPATKMTKPYGHTSDIFLRYRWGLRTTTTTVTLR